MGFLRAMRLVFDFEGGLADHPLDRGGRTNLGISTPIWRNWLRKRGEDWRPVDTITRDEAVQLYHQEYWLRGCCDALTFPLDIVHFDSMVQHGAAPRLLQRALGVEEDGVIGPITLGAAAPGRAQEHARELLWVRIAYYRTLIINDPSQRTFAPSWLGRLIDLREIVEGRRDLPAAA